MWFDATGIYDFAGITHAVTEGLAKSKALLAYYSRPILCAGLPMGADRRFLAAQTEGDPRRRVLVINPESGADHVHPIELRDAKFRNASKTDREMQRWSEPLSSTSPHSMARWPTSVRSSRPTGTAPLRWARPASSDA